MGLKGLDGITKIRSAILALPQAMSQATTDAAENLEDVINAQFDAGVDPYGNAWEPLAESTLRRGRTPPPGTDTEALRAVHVTPLQGAGIRVEFDEQYAEYFSAVRSLVPDSAPFEESAWYNAIVVAYSDAMLGNGGWRAAGGEVDGALLAAE